MADLAAIALGIGIAVLLASFWGIVLGLLAVIVTRRFTSRLESRQARDRRTQLERQLPSVCDLLAATLASGAPLLSALSAVARASAYPASEDLQRVAAALKFGAAPSSAWREAALGPEFARVSAAFQRSAVSGAPIAEVLKAVARDERRRRQTTVEIAARSAGVRAVAPLAACFLPAFVLLGIVPVVASMAIGVFAN
ncbi:MAG: type II secretion system F family protein [Actinomycetota bacterium]|nr:type II secretion system F family protein [Actinomycetota bacterium]